MRALWIDVRTRADFLVCMHSVVLLHSIIVIIKKPKLQLSVAPVTIRDYQQNIISMDTYDSPLLDRGARKKKERPSTGDIDPAK